MKRRQFIKLGSAAVVAVPLISACGSDEKGTCTVAAITLGDSTISANHSHAMTIPSADIDAGVEKTYDLGGGTHTHQFTLTAANFTTLKECGRVTPTSTVMNSHMHNLTVALA